MILIFLSLFLQSFVLLLDDDGNDDDGKDSMIGWLCMSIDDQVVCEFRLLLLLSFSSSSNENPVALFGIGHLWNSQYDSVDNTAISNANLGS